MIITVCITGLMNAGTVLLAFFRTDPDKIRVRSLAGAKRIAAVSGCGLASGFCAYRLFAAAIRMPASLKMLSALPVLAAAAVIDGREKRIPNRLVLLLPAVRILLHQLRQIGEVCRLHFVIRIRKG